MYFNFEEDGYTEFDIIYAEHGFKDDESLRPGDKVTVRRDLSTDDNVPFNVAVGMLDYAGREMTISRCDSSTTRAIKYKLVEDDGDWSWSFPMFEEYYDLVLERSDIPEDSINEIGVLYG